MSIRSEIDRVIEEEAKRKEKEIKRQEITSKRKARVEARQPPTYFAVLIGKILFRFQKAPKPRKPVTPRNGIDGYVERDFVDRPKITALTIIKEDLHNLPKKIMRGGLKKKPVEKKVPTNSNDKFDNWAEFFK